MHKQAFCKVKPLIAYIHFFNLTNRNLRIAHRHFETLTNGMEPERIARHLYELFSCKIDQFQITKVLFRCFGFYFSVHGCE